MQCIKFSCEYFMTNGVKGFRESDTQTSNINIGFKKTRNVMRTICTVAHILLPVDLKANWPQMASLGKTGLSQRVTTSFSAILDGSAVTDMGQK